MYQDDNKLIKKLVIIVSFKIVIVFALWWLFIRGNHVGVDTDVVTDRLFNETSSQPAITPKSQLIPHLFNQHSQAVNSHVYSLPYAPVLSAVWQTSTLHLPEPTLKVVPALFSSFVTAQLPSSSPRLTQILHQYLPSILFTQAVWQARTYFSSAIFAKEVFRDY